MKKILSLLVLSTVFLGCTDDDIRPEHQLDSGKKVVGFNSPFESVSYFTDEGVVDKLFPVSLIGSGNGQTTSSDLVVNYEIDYAASTAIEGVEFDFVDTTGTITIPAGSTFGNYPLKINTGQLNPTMKTELVLKLTSVTNSAVIGEQYQTLKIIFIGCQSLLAGNYSLLITWNNGANTGVRNDEVVSTLAVNTFRTRYVGGWASSTFGGIGFDFIDICGEISLLPDLTLTGYSNKILPVTSDSVPNDGEVTSPTEFNVVYNIVPYPGLDNRVYRNYYTKL